MATYKATARGYIGRLIEEGEVFEFDGPKGSWMELVDGKPAKKAKDKPAAEQAAPANGNSPSEQDVI